MDPLTLSLIGAGISGIQTVGGAIGTWIHGNKNQEYLDPANVPDIEKPEQYQSSGDMSKVIDILKAASETGFDASIREATEDKIEATRRATAQVAKETSGGSGANAFARALAAGAVADRSISDFAVQDQMIKDQNVGKYADAVSRKESMDMAAHSQFTNAMLNYNAQELNKFQTQYQMAKGEVDSYADAMGAGLNNFMDVLMYGDFSGLGKDRGPKFKKGAIGKGTGYQTYA